MRKFYLSYFITLASANLWPQLLSTLQLLCVLIACLGFGIVVKATGCRIILAGIAVALLSSHLVFSQYLAHRFDVASEPRDQVLTGVITHLIVPESNVLKFNFKPNHPRLKHVQLTWYQYGGTPSLAPGDRWTFHVRLKPPRSTLNPIGFDAERHALAHSIHAKGYIRNPEQARYLGHTYQAPLTQLRQRLYQFLDAHLSNSHKGVFIALLLGDRTQLASETQAAFMQTGTFHLLAISGLHIALVGGVAFKMALRVFKRLTALTIRRPADHYAAIFALVIALLYSMLAGFDYPTQRACIMFGVWLLPFLTGYPIRASDRLLFAITIITLVSPAAVLAPGFWMSVTAMSFILYTLAQPVAHSGVINVIRLQIRLWLGLLPLTIVFFQGVSLISMLANLIAIPLMSFVILPCILLSTLLFFISNTGASIGFNVSNEMLTYLLKGLAITAKFPHQWWTPIWPSRLGWLCVILGCVLVLLPRGLPLKSMSLILCLPLFIAPEKLNLNEFSFQVFDVGQGTAILISTRQHQLLYDTGNRFANGWSAADAIVSPNLKIMGINQLNTLVISHQDSDHSGGASAIATAFKPAHIYTGEPIPSLKASTQQCVAGQHWVWDGVVFEMLGPLNLNTKRNNRSCVLRVGNDDFHVLLTGDIEQKSEAQLVNQWGSQLHSDVLIAPHHGSKTSSSFAFIEAVDPDEVVFTTGYLNRYKHPHAQIVDRYAGRRVWTTADAGALKWVIRNNNVQRLAARDQRRFWRG